MPLATKQLIRSAVRSPPIPGLGPDRRKYKRVSVALLGRFMRANKQEFPCRVRDISVGGISIVSPVPLEMNEFIIAYFDVIGGVRGTVVRVFNGGFAMALQVSRHKQEKLAAELTWLINKEAFGTIDERRHDRQPVSNRFATLSLGDGFATKCQVLDVSLSGASLATEARPPLGAEVALGKQKAIVRRHHEKGIGVQFLDDQDPARLENIGS